jgi:DNA polymerase
VADLWLDSETFSPIPISHGVHKYAEEVEVMLITWAFEDDTPRVWDLTTGEPCPPELEEHLNDPTVAVWAQNGGKFDWVVFAADPKTRWIAEAVPLSRRRDTMVQAYSHSLPGKLETMCAALGVRDDEKKIDGKKFIRLFCMLPPKNVKDRSRRTGETHPAEWEEFKVYAKQDITAMRAASRKMPLWNYKGKQLELEALDAIKNARGFCVDIELAEAAIRASDIAKRQLAVRTGELTEGDVGAATQRDEMLRHILEIYGVDLPDMQKDTIERRALDESLPEELRELLRVRLESTTTSVAKYSTLMRGVSKDGRLRGTQQYRGAARTGRVGHRMFQPGNMMRPTMKASEIEWAIELLKMDAAHLVYSNVMKVCANAIRGTIVAGPGKKLVVADLANIEGRFAAWLAGEEWKLQAFRDYDTIVEGEFDAKGKPKRLGPDLYLVAYASSFNVPVDSINTDTIEGYNQRQIGKVEELMFQYGGGVGAWITGAATYGIDLVQMTEQVAETLPSWAADEAEDFLQYLYQEAYAKAAKAREKLNKKIEQGPDAPDFVPMPSQADWDAMCAEEEAQINATLEARKLKARFGLTEKVFITCDAIKRLWRKAHPAISSYWKELENTIEACILDPGVTRQCRKLKIRVDGDWLRVALPSGRALCYPSPRLNAVVKLPNEKEKRFPGISYMGISQYTKKWERIGTYGGKVFENVTQAGSCDQLLECQPAIEEAGFEIVLDIHDENITEVPIERDDLNPKLLGAMMCADLGWNAGLPLAAAGWEGYRNHKD